MKLNESEKHVIKVVVFLVALYGFLITLINYLVTDTETKLISSIAFIIISSACLVVGQEAIFGKLLLSIIPSTRRENSLKRGAWHLVIKFQDDKGGQEQTRGGILNFEPSLIGMKVKGGTLINHETDEIERQGWFSDDAEIIEYEDKEIIKYIYKIYGKKEKEKVEKVGIVIASRGVDDNDKPFSGIFRDISLAQNQVSREGTVSLYRDREGSQV